MFETFLKIFSKIFKIKLLYQFIFLCTNDAIIT